MKHEKIGPGLMSAILDFHECGPAAFSRRARSMGMTGIAGTQKLVFSPLGDRVERRAHADAVHVHEDARPGTGARRRRNEQRGGAGSVRGLDVQCGSHETIVR